MFRHSSLGLRNGDWISEDFRLLELLGPAASSESFLCFKIEVVLVNFYSTNDVCHARLLEIL